MLQQYKRKQKKNPFLFWSRKTFLKLDIQISNYICKALNEYNIVKYAKAQKTRNQVNKWSNQRMGDGYE